MMPRPWRPSRDWPLAIIELGPRRAKLLTIACAQPLRIERAQTARLAAEAPDDPVAALQALVFAHAIGARQAGLLIGREAVSLQTLELPSVDEREIASMLDLQMGKLTPYPRADIVWASHILGSFREGYTTVLLAIARKPVIEGALQILKAKGVLVQWIGVSSEGVMRWWQRAGQAASPEPAAGALTAVIDIDGGCTDCVILSGERLVFSHSIPIGREQLDVSEPARQRWSGEVARLPRVLRHEDITGALGRGVICGAIGGLEALTASLGSAWQVPVEASASDQAVAEAAKGRQEFGQCAWTALSGACAHLPSRPRLDLMPQETRTFHTLQARARQLARLAAGVTAVFMLTGLLYAERLVILGRYQAQLHQELSTVAVQGARLESMQRRMQRIREWLAESGRPLDALMHITASTDESVRITQVALDGTQPVVIRGRAQSAASAFAFAERLQATQAFASVQPTSVARSPSSDGSYADFELRCTWQGS